ncbi:MAG TPA: transposase [Aggregicoccus sp.]|nr:transposase [Aggregicoccus sp.]
MSELLSAPAAQRVIRRRKARDPKPRFRPDRTAQLDAVLGCLEMQVPAGHLARRVREWAAPLDVRQVEAGYSSLGCHGYAPRRTLEVWLYASQVGLHHSTSLARAMKTDAALRWLAGGHSMSEGHLRKFRRENALLFAAGLQRTVQLAAEGGFLKGEELAVDGMRLRAEASPTQVRTLERSQKRLAELARVPVQQLDEEAKRAHEEKRQKHEAAVALCQAQQRPNVVLTNAGAGLMKFPDGAAGPGHRLTACVAGVRERLVVGVLLDAAASDAGHLGPVLEATRQALLQAGVPLAAPLQAAADAGYFGQEDLDWAHANRPWVDVLVAPSLPRARRAADGTRLFGPEAFPIDEKQQATCPAGRPMHGPVQEGPTTLRWRGVGCATCPLKPRCTRGQQRSLKLDTRAQAARARMLGRMAQPDARARYNQRIATVEPVFSSLQDAMGFRRVSSRKPEAAHAEVLLKLLAYNLSRLAAAKRLLCVQVSLRPQPGGSWLLLLPAAA